MMRTRGRQRNVGRLRVAAGGVAGPPVAALSGSPLSGYGPLAVAFRYTGRRGSTFLWEKNDGSGWVPFDGTPAARNPTETFADGTWSVRVTATNAAGSDTATRADYVTAATYSPSLDFTEPRNSQYVGSVV